MEGSGKRSRLTALPPLLPLQPHLPADKARGAPGPEQQHLLITAPSSSSSSLESSASAADRRVPAGTQPPAPGAEKAGGSGEAWASSSSSGEWREPTWLPSPRFLFLPGFYLCRLLRGLPCKARPELLAGHRNDCVTSLGSPASLLSLLPFRCNAEPQTSFISLNPPNPAYLCPCGFFPQEHPSF